jgi:hypothetical protein
MLQALNIKIFNGYNSIDNVFDDWKKISDRMGKKRYFHMFEFYKAYMDALEKDPDSVYFFILYDDKNPIAIFPFRKMVWKFGVTQIRALVSLHHFEMGPYDFIIQEQDKSGYIFQMFLEKLKDIPEMQWDVMSILNILDDSCANLALNNVLKLHKLYHHFTKCYYLSVDSYDRIIGNASSNFRRQLKRSKVKLSKSGPSSFASINKSPDLEEAYLRFLRVEGSGWKRNLGTAVEQHEDRVNFYRNIIQYYSVSNSCEIYELKLNDQTIASLFTITCEDTCYLLKMGYDEEFEHVSPGKLLVDYLVKCCCDSRFITELNFASDASHIDHWNPSQYAQSNCYLICNTLNGVFLYIFLSLFLAIRKIPWLYDNFLVPVQKFFK